MKTPRWLSKVLRYARSRIDRSKRYRALPELRHFDQEEREAQRRHGRPEDVRAKRKAFMTECLREGR